MKQPKLLVACEYSQRVMTAFLKKGFDAYSNDIIDTIGDYPERHLKMDAREAVASRHWDLIIAHPPCTYLTVTQVLAKGGNPYHNAERYEKMLKSKDFFMFFWLYTKSPICIENPRPIKLAALPKETQVVDPTMFGSSYTKRTYFWLRDLPPLLPTTSIPTNPKSYVHCTRGGKKRSLIDPYLAQAMADQWAPLFL